MMLPHAKELIGFLPLSELYTEYALHDRLQVFAEKGLDCVACGRVGTLLALGRETSRKADKVGRVHVDLYTDDFVLITVDHIVPKKMAKQWGWSKEMMESLDNKQTMCEPCNSAKGHKIFNPQQESNYRRQMQNNKQHPKQYKKSGILVSLVPNIHAMLGDAV